jgi:hypothetical protein
MSLEMEYSKQMAEKAFGSQKPEAICRALVAVAFCEPDWKWVQDKCLCFLQNKDPAISGLAATCLGHVARIHQKLEREKVVAALCSRCEDTDIAGRIEDALNDINMFVPNESVIDRDELANPRAICRK